MSGEWTSSAYGNQSLRFSWLLPRTPLQEDRGETFDMGALCALTSGSPIPVRTFDEPEGPALFSADNDSDELGVYTWIFGKRYYKRTPFTLNVASEDSRVRYLSELEALKPGEELPDGVKERFLTDVLQVYIAIYVAARPAEGTASDAVALEILRRLGGHVAANAAWYDARYCSEPDLKLYAVFCELACSVGPGSALELLMDSEYRWMWASEIRTLIDGRVVACHTPDDVREVIDRVRRSWEVAEEALYDCHGLVSEAVAHLHHLESYRSLSLLPHVDEVD
jgi:hypothetical protein